ncbi:hypothetical protein CU254_42560 (plasmid) [Amycolatopsis sp. AA4]|uniref:hypothetical protein n=1 Tax=Actinomycetes TaxID=1760 RepID=UPI0001B5715B|nr:MULTISPECIES: hypothetical protein [Actinomycetes]ATY17270.1 hypothetical protein CU254_42560 [Amycolatopsis sp. AA4]EFL12671.1 predicted protein [Streptomyces sp. AA4]
MSTAITDTSGASGPAGRLEILAREHGITAAQQQLRAELGDDVQAYREALDDWAATRRVWLVGYRRRTAPGRWEIGGQAFVVAENPLVARVLVEQDPDVRMWGADAYGVPGRDRVGLTCDRIHVGPGDVRQH